MLRHIGSVMSHSLVFGVQNMFIGSVEKLVFPVMLTAGDW